MSMQFEKRRVLYVDSLHVYTDQRQVHVQQHIEQLEELFESPRWLHAQKGGV